MKYIGRTNRQYQSQRSGKDGNAYKLCTYFWEAIQRDGWPNFEYSVLEDGLTKEETEEREKYWIEKENSVWPNGYNLQTGGHHHQDHIETLQKQSFAHRGKKHSDEARQKIVDKLLNCPKTSTSVSQYSKEGQFIAEYPSIREASRQTRIRRSHISDCCCGRIKTSGNFIWKYSSSKRY